MYRPLSEKEQNKTKTKKKEKGGGEKKTYSHTYVKKLHLQLIAQQTQ